MMRPCIIVGVLCMISAVTASVTQILAKTSTLANSQTSATVTLTLFYESSIYECSVSPVSQDTAYMCKEDEGTIVTLQDDCGGISYDPPFMKVSNANADAVMLSKLEFATDDGNTFTIQGACVDDDQLANYFGYYVEENLLSDTIECDAGQTALSAICLDTDDCGVTEQIVFFDRVANTVVDNADLAVEPAFSATEYDGSSCPLNPKGRVNSISITTSSVANAQTLATVTLTLFFRSGIYECKLIPSSQLTEYFCDASVWVKQMDCGVVYDPPFIKVTNDNTDAVMIESFKFMVGSNVYTTSSSFCMEDDQFYNGAGYYLEDSLMDESAGCDVGYTGVVAVCVDTDDCIVAGMIVYFGNKNVVETGAEVDIVSEAAGQMYDGVSCPEHPNPSIQEGCELDLVTYLEQCQCSTSVSDSLSSARSAPMNFAHSAPMNFARSPPMNFAKNGGRSSSTDLSQITDALEAMTASQEMARLQMESAIMMSFLGFSLLNVVVTALMVWSCGRCSARRQRKYKAVTFDDSEVNE